MQPGDVPETYADVSDLVRDTGFCPGTSLQEGIVLLYCVVSRVLRSS